LIDKKPGSAGIAHHFEGSGPAGGKNLLIEMNRKQGTANNLYDK